MARSIKLTRPNLGGESSTGNAVYILVDTILFFEEKFLEGKFQGTFIFFSSTVGLDYAPVIVTESAEEIHQKINATS